MPGTTVKTILAIDDEKAVLLWLEKILKPEGYSFIGAVSVQQALESLKSWRPDLVILDVVMPGVGGVAFLKGITNSAGNIQFPVLVLSGNPKYQEFFAEVGVVGFLQKPASREMLLAKVSEIIGVSKVVDDPPQGVLPSNGKRVLLADDDKGSSAIIGGMLKRAGFLVERTYSGAEVLSMSLAFRPELILMKKIMSGGNGDRVASLLAATPDVLDIPVVIFEDAGDEQTGTRLKERHRNIKGYLKDYGLNAMLAELRRILVLG